MNTKTNIYYTITSCRVYDNYGSRDGYLGTGLGFFLNLKNFHIVRISGKLFVFANVKVVQI